MELTEPVYPPLVMPDSVERETVTIWNKGVALDADLYRPRAAPTSTPGVVLCHGWGGSKRTCERYAALFAEAGMIALSFTQATWFGSGPHLRMRAQQPVSDAPAKGSPEVHRVRNVVDPIDWLHNFRAAVDYLEGEPGVDRKRIGAWGTSFGGGVAMHSAANDRRIRALSVQVAYVAPLAGPQLAHANQRAIDSARGTYDPIAKGFDVMPRVAGFTEFARWTQYDVLGQLDRLNVPTVMLDAGKEELFSIADHCGRAYEILKAKPGQIARYEVIPGIDHYGIYFDGYARSSQVAVDWFRDHL
jgi:dienelactone hydrolase